MKYTKLLLMTCMMALMSISARAQESTTTTADRDYNTGVGVRIGGAVSGINIKGFVNDRSALEGIIGFGRHSFILTGLYERHFDIPEASGLQWYAGGGVHMGFFSHRGRYLLYKYKDDRVYVVEEGRTAVIPGIDFILGIEYKFNNAPLVLGADVKPFIDFWDGGASGYFDGALNFRFVF
jgi:hypothetical protein